MKKQMPYSLHTLTKPVIILFLLTPFFWQQQLLARDHTEEDYQSYNLEIDEAKAFSLCSEANTTQDYWACGAKNIERYDAENYKTLKKIGRQLDKETQTLLIEAYQVATAYLELKVDREDAAGDIGSGRVEEVILWTINRNNDYIKLVKKIKNSLFIPKPTQNFSTADKALNKVYQTAIARLNELESKNISIATSADMIKKIENLWIKHRDISSKLFARLNSAVDENTWKIWLTEVRTADLTRFIAICDNAEKNHGQP